MYSIKYRGSRFMHVSAAACTTQTKVSSSTCLLLPAQLRLNGCEARSQGLADLDGGVGGLWGIVKERATSTIDCSVYVHGVRTRQQQQHHHHQQQQQQQNRCSSSARASQWRSAGPHVCAPHPACHLALTDMAPPTLTLLLHS